MDNPKRKISQKKYTIYIYVYTRLVSNVSDLNIKIRVVVKKFFDFGLAVVQDQSVNAFGKNWPAVIEDLFLNGHTITQIKTKLRVLADSKIVYKRNQSMKIFRIQVVLSTKVHGTSKFIFKQWNRDWEWWTVVIVFLWNSVIIEALHNGVLSSDSLINPVIFFNAYFLYSFFLFILIISLLLKSGFVKFIETSNTKS